MQGLKADEERQILGEILTNKLSLIEEYIHNRLTVFEKILKIHDKELKEHDKDINILKAKLA